MPPPPPSVRYGCSVGCSSYYSFRSHTFFDASPRQSCHRPLKIMPPPPPSVRYGCSVGCSSYYSVRSHTSVDASPRQRYASNHESRNLPQPSNGAGGGRSTASGCDREGVVGERKLSVLFFTSQWLLVRVWGQQQTTSASSNPM